ncbi:MAG: transposase zinc-binding domain-containing protein, partial [Myxococcota bacterium]|nr:transposase zinc-binding domain-containing protein [Myxococcota bacterium]
MKPLSRDTLRLSVDSPTSRKRPETTQDRGLARVRAAPAHGRPRASLRSAPTDREVLYSLVRQHLESFLAYARRHYDGGLPRYVENELRADLKCGVFSEGFTRCHCDMCGHDLLVAFSRHGRSICPSCCGRRMAERANVVLELREA